jgi:uncharacterized protein YndB with AHSA1/START domain
MPDIVHDFPIFAPVGAVFDAIATPSGLDAWWTKESEGDPRQGSTYRLSFGPDYEWRATVRRCEPNREIEWEFTTADADWVGTRVGLHLTEGKGVTQIRFHHTGWREENEHYRISCYCWAMYLRLLRRYVERGETVPYEERLDA